MVAYYCYLLRSLATPTSRASYIGFSTNPHHRLRQHNGEVSAGAWHTSKRRPWIHVVVIEGFPNKVTALMFEWQWQHPDKSRHTGNTSAIVAGGSGSTAPPRRKSYHGYKAKLETLKLLLDQPLWQQLGLRVHIVDDSCHTTILTLLGHNRRIVLMPSTPLIISQLNSSVTPATTTTTTTSCPADVVVQGRCLLCKEEAGSWKVWQCASCSSLHHLHCLGIAMVNTATESVVDLVPRQGVCQGCGTRLMWSAIVQQHRKATPNASTTTDLGDNDIEDEENEEDVSVSEEEEGEVDDNPSVYAIPTS
eukprot:gene7492-8283_t